MKVNVSFEILFILEKPAVEWDKEIVEKMEKLGFKISQPLNVFDGRQPHIAIYPNIINTTNE